MEFGGHGDRPPRRGGRRRRPAPRRRRTEPAPAGSASRARSPAFRRALAAAFARELEDLAETRFADVLNPRKVRELIGDPRVRLIHPAALGDVVVEAQARIVRGLSRRKVSLVGYLDGDLARQIDALLDEDFVLARPAEALISSLMGQELVQQLFAEIIYTSILSFNKRVNPIFGGMAVMMLEDQIKGAVRLILPVVQKQAVAFALSRGNRALLMDFVRVFIRHLLREPLPHYMAMVSAGQREKAELLLRRALTSRRLENALRAAAQTGWDTFWEQMKDRRVGEVIRIDRHVRWLARQAADGLAAVLARPHIARVVFEGPADSE